MRLKHSKLELNNTNYKGIPALTPTVVHNYLTEIGKQWKPGNGCAVELGCWFGATTVALLEGLTEAGFDQNVYCYDRWKATREQVIKAHGEGLIIHNKEDLYPLFDSNVERFDHTVITYQGNISDTIKDYPNDLIYVCLFDAPKRNPVFMDAISKLLSNFVAGETVLGLLDYYFYRGILQSGRRKEAMAPVRFIEQFSDCFEKVAEWPEQSDCVFFKYVKKIDNEKFELFKSKIY